MTGVESTDLENELPELLAARAQRVTVIPDVTLLAPDAMGEPSNVAPLAGSTTSSAARRAPWFAAAAALLAVVGGVFALTRGGTSDVDLAASDPTMSAAVDEFRAQPEGEPRELIVWLDPDATEEQVAVVAQALAASPFVESSTYLDRDSSYAEFEEYWSETPEILAAVTPDQMPTSFRVVLAEPLDVALPAVAAELDQLGGVIDVDYDRDFGADTGADEPWLVEIQLDAALTDEHYRTIEETILRDAAVGALPEIDEDLTDEVRVATNQPLALAYNVRALPGVRRVDLDPAWSTGPLFLLPPSGVALDGLQGFVPDSADPAMETTTPSEGVAIGRSTEAGFDQLMAVTLLPDREFGASQIRIIDGREVMVATDVENTAAERIDDGRWLHFYVNDLDTDLEGLVTATSVVDGAIVFETFDDVVELARVSEVSPPGLAVTVLPREPRLDAAVSFSAVPAPADISLVVLAVSVETVTTVEVRGQLGYLAAGAGVGAADGEAVVWWEPTGHMIYVTTTEPEGAVAVAEELTAVDEATWRAAFPESAVSD